MTIKELIEKLSEFPQNRRVYLWVQDGPTSSIGDECIDVKEGEEVNKEKVANLFSY